MVIEWIFSSIIAKHDDGPDILRIPVVARAKNLQIRVVPQNRSLLLHHLSPTWVLRVWEWLSIMQDPTSFQLVAAPLHRVLESASSQQKGFEKIGGGDLPHLKKPTLVIRPWLDVSGTRNYGHGLGSYFCQNFPMNIWGLASHFYHMALES